MESDLENCASEKNPGHAPGFVDYHELMKNYYFEVANGKTLYDKKNPSLLLIKTGFGQTMHLALTLFSLALVQLLL